MKRFYTFRKRGCPLSMQIELPKLYLIGAYSFLLLIVFLCNVGIGSLFIPPWDVFLSLLGIGNPDYSIVIDQFRLPRIVTALLAGALLASAGVLLQSLVRNPLASPDLIGVTQGAAVAGVGFLLFSESLSISLLPLATMCGAISTTFLVYVLAWKQGITPLRLVLIGIGIDAVLQGIVKLLMIVSPFYNTSKAQLWLTGSLYGSTWHDVIILLVGSLLLLPAAWLLADSINAYQLGDEVATALGSSVQQNRLFMLIVSAMMISFAVSVAGPIGFVGLLAPHIARKLVGTSFAYLLPLTALIGATITMIADLLGRFAFTPLDLPAGIFTSLIGAPFFIYLLLRRNKS